MPLKDTDLRDTIINVVLWTGIGTTGVFKVMKEIGMAYSMVLPTIIGTITLGLLLYKVYIIIKRELGK